MKICKKAYYSSALSIWISMSTWKGLSFVYKEFSAYEKLRKSGRLKALSLRSLYTSRGILSALMDIESPCKCQHRLKLNVTCHRTNWYTVYIHSIKPSGGLFFQALLAGGGGLIWEGYLVKLYNNFLSKSNECKQLCILTILPQL